jgi:hypothetical protein
MYVALLFYLVFTNILILFVWSLLMRYENYVYKKNKKFSKRSYKRKYTQYFLKSMHRKNNFNL